MTRDLKEAYRADEPMTLDERAEAQRLISAEYDHQVGDAVKRSMAFRALANSTTCPIAADAYRLAAEAALDALPCEPNKNMVD